MVRREPYARPLPPSGKGRILFGGNQMIKVLHVISDTGIGGAGVLLSNCLEHADKALFSYSVALPRGSLLTTRLDKMGIRIIPLDGLADKSADPAAIPALLALIKQERPDVLHTHAGLSARIAGLMADVPVRVNTKHCLTGSGGYKRLRGGMENLLSTHFIATAEAAAETLLASGVYSTKIHIIPNGSNPIPALSVEKKSQLKKELDIPDSAFIVGIAARIERGKGQEILLEAAKLCLGQEPTIYFLIVGTGSMEKELWQRTEEWGLSHNVKFLGFRENIGEIMNLFDINVNCSYISETSSLSLSEGMSLGIVPVVSHVGGNPFMADFGRCGVIVPPNDPEALATALLALFHAPKARAELSRRSLSHYRENFRAEEMARRTESLYLSALAKLTIDK